MLRHYGTFPWASRKDRNLAQPESRNQVPNTGWEFEFFALWKTSGSNPQIRLIEALQPDSCVQNQTRRKVGRIGGVEKKKGRGKKGKEINKVSCSLPSHVSLASCLCKEGNRDERTPVVAAGPSPSTGELVPKHPECSGCQS